MHAAVFKLLQSIRASIYFLLFNNYLKNIVFQVGSEEGSI